MLFGAEDIAVFLQRDNFFAIIDKAFQDKSEELLQGSLDRAFDGQALSVHHLEAALHD